MEFLHNFVQEMIGKGFWYGFAQAMGIIVTVFVQAAMNIVMQPMGIPTLTGPFCVATWLFLLPMIRLDYQTELDHSNWSVENKPHLARHSSKKPK